MRLQQGDRAGRKEVNIFKKKKVSMGIKVVSKKKTVKNYEESPENKQVMMGKILEIKQIGF